MTAPALNVAGIPASNADLHTATQALANADPGYRKAQGYYCGDIPEVFASVRLRRAMRVTGIAFQFNFARLPVDARSERIQISTVTATPDSANTALEELWKSNKLNLVSRQIQRRALELGDGYAMVWPDPDDESGNTVDICYNSPRSVRVFYDPERPLKKTFAVKQWSVDPNTIRADLYYPDRIEKYIRIGKGAKAAWTQYVDEPGDEWPYENPFGEIPFFHFRTDDPYGEPCHKGFYGPQDAIHKLIISHMAGVDYQAFPQRYALVHPDSDTSEPASADEDEFAFANDTGATSPDTEGRSQFQADPGSVWFMQGIQGVGQFDVASPANFTDPMLTYLRFGAQITNTPIHRIDPTGDAPSGESLRTSEAPFVKACQDLMESFEDTWCELFTFALKVAGVAVSDIDVQWKPAQSVDDVEGWQTVQTKLAAGLPVRQAFLEAGYSTDQVEEWFGEEADDLGFAVDLLVKIGTALASLGSAVSLGAVSDAQVQALIASIIGDPDGDGIADIMDPDDAGPGAREMADEIATAKAAARPAIPAFPPQQPDVTPPPDGAGVAA
jgi:hypothetical protein